MTAVSTSAWPRQGWSVWLPVAAACLAVLLIFSPTAVDMVGIWIRSETFQHAFLVPPIAAWLVWRRRDQLKGVPLQPTLWPLLPMAMLCLLWLLGDIALVAAAAHFALVGLLVLSIVALCGWQVSRLLLFPLAFLFFMVPFGEFAVPYLQEWTADVTVLALQATGIPVYREGMQFVIPTGTWSVVEACSGIRYIIACVMVGVLFAHLNYQSTRRRLIFMLAALIVPVIANWLRAYTIVMIGHLTGSPMILGVEHTTYGWFLFGAVVMVMFWVGARWAEHEPEAQAGAQPAQATPAGQPQRAGPSPAAGYAPALQVLTAIVVLMLGAQAWAWQVHRSDLAHEPRLSLPEGQQAWQVDPQRLALEWEPGFQNPGVVAMRSYVLDGRRVDLWVGYYGRQTDESKLVTSMHRVASKESGLWRSQGTGERPAQDALPRFATSVVSPGRAPSLAPTERYRTWHVFWLQGGWVLSPPEVKLRQALDKLMGRGESGAVVLLSTAQTDDADATLEKFARAHMGAVGSRLQAARESRVDLP